MLLPFVLIAAAGPAAPDPVTVFAGRYDARHPVRPHDGISSAETVVEIVPVAPDAAYVRVHDESYGNHICGFRGVAQRDGDRLVYRNPSKPNQQPCTLAIAHQGGRLVLEDHNGCRSWCGVNASLSGVAVPFTSRRPITYMARLKASRPFAEAMSEWKR